MDMDREEQRGRRGFVVAGAMAGVAGCLPGPAAAQFNVPGILGAGQQIMQAMNLNEDDEIKIGQAHYEPYIAKSGGRVPDRSLQDALKAFARPYIATSQRPRLPWEITLLNNSTVNAWAMPGGKLAVNAALVSHCATPEELASVVAHEVGHAEKSHSIQQMRNQAFINSMGSMGRSMLGGRAGGISGEVLQALEGPLYGMILSGYSRQNEHEADAHILHVFERTGTDPHQAHRFFETLQRLYPPNDKATTSLFSTHPGTSERIARIKADAARFPVRAPSASSARHPGWADLKRRYPTPKA